MSCGIVPQPPPKSRPLSRAHRHTYCRQNTHSPVRRRATQTKTERHNEEWMTQKLDPNTLVWRLVPIKCTAAFHRGFSDLSSSTRCLWSTFSHVYWTVLWGIVLEFEPGNNAKLTHRCRSSHGAVPSAGNDMSCGCHPFNLRPLWPRLDAIWANACWTGIPHRVLIDE